MKTLVVLDESLIRYLLLAVGRPSELAAAHPLRDEAERQLQVALQVLELARPEKEA